MPLTTIFGTAQLAIQDALTAALDTSGLVPVAPNFITVSINRRDFTAQNKGDVLERREEFRGELKDILQAFLKSHGWRVGGNGELLLNVLLRSISRECMVQVKTADMLYDLAIHDDRGDRMMSIPWTSAVIGRAHERPPRAFVPLTDTSRMLSRQHLLLRFSDLKLTAKLLGRNRTTLNGRDLDDEEVTVDDGDKIACEHCTLTIKFRV